MLWMAAVLQPHASFWAGKKNATEAEKWLLEVMDEGERRLGGVSLVAGSEALNQDANGEAGELIVSELVKQSGREGPTQVSVVAWALAVLRNSGGRGGGGTGRLGGVWVSQMCYVGSTKNFVGWKERTRQRVTIAGSVLDSPRLALKAPQ